MIFRNTNSLNSRTLKFLVAGFALSLMHSLPLNAKPVFLSSMVAQANMVHGSNLSNVSIIGGFYFLVLFGIGYAVDRHYNLRKNKEGDIE